MATYDYREAVKDDVLDYIRCEVSLDDYLERDEFEEWLYDQLWTCDSVTGNASGSYTFNTWQAEEYLAHNWDLLEEALDEFGIDGCNPIAKGAEWCDVTIRCYLLGECIAAALEELEEATND